MAQLISTRALAVAVVLTALLVSLSAGAAAAAGPTVTRTVNTCEGLTKFPDVDYDYDCETLRYTYSTKLKIVGKALATGRFAAVDKQTTVDGPLALYVRVIAPPRQSRHVVWSVLCEKDDDIEVEAGSYETRSSKMRAIQRTVKDPDSCTFGATSAVERGPLRLRLIARVINKVIKREVVSP